MKVVVTGAGGFAGSHLVAALGRAGHEVVSWVRRETPGALVVDLTRIAPAMLEGVDAVVHTAGVAHLSPRPGEDLSALFHEGNTAVTTALARAVAASEVRVLVHLSSIAAAGYTEFSAGAGLSENQAIAPAGPYGESKLRAEAPVGELRRVGKLGVNLRPPLIYGSGARGNWPRLLQLARSPLPLPFGSVRNRRSFLGIENLGDLVLTILSQADEPGLSGTYHVADAEVFSLREVIATLRAAAGKKAGLVPFPPGLMKTLLKAAGRGSMGDGLFGDLVVDATRVREAFAWSPPVATLDGMRSDMS
jgi:nucleoside-diphosphate-sugar epimerase